MASTSEESDADLLSQIEVVFVCNTCDSTYSVPASIVRESQRLVAEDYCGESLLECDALYYATLIDAEAIADLERAWAHFQESATSHGGIRVAVVGANTGATEIDERALQRLHRRVEGLQRTERREMDLGDGMPLEPALEVLGQRLHLGQLGHGSSLAATAAVGRVDGAGGCAVGWPPFGRRDRWLGHRQGRVLAFVNTVS